MCDGHFDGPRKVHCRLGRLFIMAHGMSCLRVRDSMTRKTPNHQVAREDDSATNKDTAITDVLHPGFFNLEVFCTTANEYLKLQGV